MRLVRILVIGMREFPFREFMYDKRRGINLPINIFCVSILFVTFENTFVLNEFSESGNGFFRFLGKKMS